MTPYGFKPWFILLLGTFVAALRQKVHDPRDDVPELYEGDMALTAEQVQALEKEPKPLDKGWDQAQTRAALRNPRQLWPDGIIPYVINRRIDAEGRQLIKNSMDDWESKVCVHFKAREQEEGYLEFVYKKGCWSYVGYIGRRQEVSIGRFTKDPPCEQGALTHELGHALGFFHEQSRPDRDKYVTIRWENIRRGTEKNFEKESTRVVDSRGGKYDMGSLMHYSKYAGNNRPGVVTIDPKDPSADTGQRKGPSAGDIEQARAMYNCDAAAGKAAGKTGGRPSTERPGPKPRPKPRPKPAPPAGPQYPRPPAGGCITTKIYRNGRLYRIKTVCRGRNQDSKGPDSKVNSKDDAAGREAGKTGGRPSTERPGPKPAPPACTQYTPAGGCTSNQGNCTITTKIYRNGRLQRIKTVCRGRNQDSKGPDSKVNSKGPNDENGKPPSTDIHVLKRTFNKMKTRPNTKHFQSLV